MEMVMSSYHLTQEQALEIVENAFKTVETKDPYSQGEYLQCIINAALDKVLGEPVAFIDGKDVILANEGLYLGNDTLLYAPKGLT
jgi:hypothetical protein